MDNDSISVDVIIERYRNRREQYLREMADSAFETLRQCIAHWASEQWIDEHNDALRRIAIAFVPYPQDATELRDHVRREEIEQLVLMIEVRQAEAMS